MKNIFLPVLLIVTLTGYSQNPYENVTTVSADGLVFEVKLSDASFMISNATNTLGKKGTLYYRDGRELETLDEYAQVDAALHWADDQAIREAFGDEVIASLRSYDHNVMEIFYVVGPDGTILEVAFIMNPIPELLALKPEVFADLERKLKKYARWELNEFSKQLKYIQMVGFISFRKIRLSSELLPTIPLDSVPAIGAIQCKYPFKCIFQKDNRLFTFVCRPDDIKPVVWDVWKIRSTIV